MLVQILKFVPFDTAESTPTSRGPMAKRDNNTKFSAHNLVCITGLRIDGTHYPVHQFSHRSNADPMHQATPRRRFSPGVWKTIANRTPECYEHGPNAKMIALACRHVPIRE